MSTKRGIIVSPFVFDGRSLSVNGAINDISLRNYLLYWDKIDYPDNNIVSTGMSPELEFLLSEKILERTIIKFHSFSGNVGFSMVLMQSAAFDIHNKKEPGQWTLGQQSYQFVVSDERAENIKAVEMELYKALPVPNREIPLADILDFKNRRHAELIALRSAMDKLYLEIVSSGDIPRAKNAALVRLEQTISDLNLVAHESWPVKLLSSLKVQINVPNLISNALIGSGAAVCFGFSPAAGAAIGAAATSIKFDLGISKEIKDLPPSLKDFVYLHRLEKEL